MFNIQTQIGIFFFLFYSDVNTSVVGNSKLVMRRQEDTQLTDTIIQKSLPLDISSSVPP